MKILGHKNIQQFCAALLFLFIPTDCIKANEDTGMLINASVGLTYSFAPEILSNYWTRGVQFSAGVGGNISQSLFFLFSIKHHNYSQKKDITPIGGHANINELYIVLNKKLLLKKYTPYFEISLGYMVLNTPKIYYQDVADYFPVQEENLVEYSFNDKGFTFGAGSGLNFYIDKISFFHIGIDYKIGALALESSHSFSIVAGVVFSISRRKEWGDS